MNGMIMNTVRQRMSTYDGNDNEHGTSVDEHV